MLDSSVVLALGLQWFRIPVHHDLHQQNGGDSFLYRSTSFKVMVCIKHLIYKRS